VVTVVSEETGIISVAYNGRLKRGFDGPRLRRLLTSFLSRDPNGFGEDGGRPGFVFEEAGND
jgi:diadenylate cyclase